MQKILTLELQKVIRFESESEDGEPFSLTVSFFRDENDLFVVRGMQSDYFILNYKKEHVDVRAFYEDWTHCFEELKDENMDSLIARVKKRIEDKKAWMKIRQINGDTHTHKSRSVKNSSAFDCLEEFTTLTMR